MTDIKMSADAGTTSVNRTGVYLAVLQLVFTLGWTTYVIYLPKLAADVGIAPSAVILILMLDQAIFTITDTAMGIAADKIAPFVGRLGVFVGTLTAVSCAAFVALPFVAGTGPNAQTWFIALIVIWVITSSALRAPPLTLLGKHRAKPAIPFLSALCWRGACRRPQHPDRDTVHRRRGLGMHADERGLGGSRHRRPRRGGQGGGPGIFGAGACDFRTNGGGRGWLAEAAGICAAAAVGAGGMLVGRRRRVAGDRRIAGSAKHADAAGLNSPVIPRCAIAHLRMRRLAQARNPYSRWWLWIPGSSLRAAPE
jgi:hypothetical protein